LVLEQNPPKQGLKHGCCVGGNSYCLVLEQNPPKQGLKPIFYPHYKEKATSVLEQNPPKQGLKQQRKNITIEPLPGFRAKSTKTRIETGSKV